ncbi:hypothetical protein ABIC99_003642 [Sphaerotilus sulfidivorans]|uniref:DUF3375 domain-containing protein n=1 Tax=Sphaerotilus sulfidivorans TaxID=639200 RepID=A0ABV2IU94_9BURK|nr:DUF3375 domain-containing protein [Sphaerotilus sulfidivorans]NZD47748.1 DUF3375 domain-containing protein [Sphaerotilus sulfidivorans]
MKVLHTSEAYQAIREGRVWRLLAADLAPQVLAMLGDLFMGDDKVLPGSVLFERLTRDLEALRSQGHALPQTAQAYAADWLSQGWLSRRFPEGASEEVYELTADAVTALRLIDSIHRPRTAATESRLATVMQQVIGLAEETDTNAHRRLAALMAERDRLDQDIAAVQRGQARTLPEDRAVERAREVIALAQDLTADFRHVRDAFERLHRDLRQSLMEHEGHRGDVLEQLFAGVDLIGNSEAGRTFTAFWRLLTDGEQSLALTESLDAVTHRDFARRLDAGERRFLQSLTTTLLAEGGEVHNVLQQFARSLRSFVQSREFQENRRLHVLLKQAQLAALAAKDHVRANEPSGFTLSLTSSRIRSVAQWTLYDPSLRLPDAHMEDAAPSPWSLQDVEALVRQSEIDFPTLRAHIRAVLLETSQASIADVLRRFPAEQGFGTVVGYVALGARHGEVTEAIQHVSWQSADGERRSARIPAIYFLRETFVDALQ